jgi:hypothetical protein
VKFERTDLPAMRASQLLLVEHSYGQRQLTGLLEKVNVVFAGFFGLLFSILDHPLCIEFDVGGQHNFCSIEQEEGCEASITIWSYAQAPEY